MENENLSLKLWSTLRCHGTESHLTFLKKFVHRPNDYLLVITNAESLFIEVLTFEEIKVRCRNLNNRLEAPVKSIISHIEQSLKDDLNQNFTFTPVTGGMHLNLNNLFHEMPFNWVFKCVRDQSGLIRSTLIEPLVITVARLVLENEALKNLLHEKDAELEEYAENEAVQSKFTIKTDKFCKEKFGLKICQMKDYVTVLSQNALTAVAGSAFNNQLIMSSEHRKSNDVSTRSESPSKGNIAVVAAVDVSAAKVIKQ
ncbi:non-homologous end-joining factor 1-like [Ciona intestinalis]